ncbi:hypothetical protein IFM89_000779 [Coptis chinensis]|uniref:E2F/DP family winged-helix DNA-binding domain-containing protein n=1 Tax=Coptis chinensis TaxID=261450 RepID=A0A835M8K2_9MAGN|nr:hypothetical protein IFM89_000779 [Coptis chinensis]
MENRKSKSLGLLCTNFLSLYSRQNVDTIDIRDVTRQLGGERRRVYNIINVLEGIGVLEKKRKSVYCLKGLGELPKALNQLKEEALRDKSYCNFGASNNSSGISDDRGDEQSHDSSNLSGQENSSIGVPLLNSSLSSTHKIKTEKYLGLLTQNFVKLVLCSDNNLVTFDEIGRILFGDNHNPSQNNSKSKLRRLYDIANVLSSINLIEKTPDAATGKLAYKWLGISGALENGSLMSKKRAFGTDITKTTVKRNQAFTLADENTYQNAERHMQTKCKGFQYGINHNKMHQQPKQLKQHSDDVGSGPSCPTGFPKDDVAENKTAKRFRDWESLMSSHHPQYYNQELGEIFTHYVDAWKSWYAEVTGKQQTQLL